MTGDDVKKVFVFYNYTPSLAAAILFSVLFFIVTIARITRMLMKKTWYFIPFVLGCLYKFPRAATPAIEAQPSPLPSI